MVYLQMLETPLIRCAHNGHFESVQFLVEQGADVNAIDLVRSVCIAMSCYHTWYLASSASMCLSCHAIPVWQHCIGSSLRHLRITLDGDSQDHHDSASSINTAICHEASCNLQAKQLQSQSSRIQMAKLMTEAE